MSPRFAILSDIHGNLPALEAVAADLQPRRLDAVLNLGDHISGPLWPEETLQFLMKQDWVHIAGNHERQLVTQQPDEMGASNRHAFERLDKAGLDWLRSLPAAMKFGEDLFLFHGSPSSDMVYLLETVEHGHVRLATFEEIEQRLRDGARAPVMVCGHTHVPRLVQMSDGTLIVNPGSVGLQAYDDDTPAAHVIENGSPHARYAIMERHENGWQVEQIVLPYDHRRAAAQAGRNGRLDWELGLLSGTMQSVQSS